MGSKAAIYVIVGPYRSDPPCPRAAMQAAGHAEPIHSPRQPSCPSHVRALRHSRPWHRRDVFQTVHPAARYQGPKLPRAPCPRSRRWLHVRTGLPVLMRPCLPIFWCQACSRTRACPRRAFQAPKHGNPPSAHSPCARYEFSCVPSNKWFAGVLTHGQVNSYPRRFSNRLGHDAQAPGAQRPANLGPNALLKISRSDKSQEIGPVCRHAPTLLGGCQLRGFQGPWDLFPGQVRYAKALAWYVFASLNPHGDICHGPCPHSTTRS